MATTYYKRDGTGTVNWNSATSWSTVSASSSTNSGTYPVAGDTANFTSGSIGGTVNVASACAVLNMTGFASTLTGSTFNLTVSGGTTLQGAFAGWTTGQLSITGGGITLAATPTGTAFPIITFSTAAPTLTSGGFVWSGPMTFNFNSTFTLAGNWQNNGLTTVSTAATISGAYTLTFAGGLTQTADLTANNTAISITGGTWTGLTTNAYINGTANVNLGTIALSSGCQIYTSAGTTTLLAGSTISGTGTLVFFYAGTVSLTTNGVVIPNMSVGSSSQTIALTGNLLVSGTLNLSMSGSGETFTGAYDIQVGNLVANWTPWAGGDYVKFPINRSVTVTNGIYIGGATNFFAPSPNTIQSGTASTAFSLNYLGPLSNENIFGTNFTDVKTDGSSIGAWATSTAYVVGNTVAQGGKFYLCAIAHTSGTFATDLANGDWTLMNLQPLLAQYWTTPSTFTRTTGIANIRANSFVGF